MKSHTRALLAERPFRYYLIGRTTSELGSSLSPLALAFGVLDVGGHATDLGLILGAAAVPQLLLTLFGGVAGDRWERRRILIVSDVVMGIAQAICAILLLSHSASLWKLAGLQFVIGCASSFFNPASNGAVRDFVGATRVQHAQSILGITKSTTRIAGPALAAVLIAATNAGAALALDALTFFVSALALSKVSLLHTRVVMQASIWHDLRSGWNEVVSRSWVLSYIASACVYQATVLPALAILGPVLAKSGMGGATAWAMVMSARSIGALLSGFALLRWRPLRPMLAAVRLLFLSMPFIAVLAVPGIHVGWLLVPAVLAGMAVPMADTLWFAALAEHIPDEAQARVSSYDWLGSLAAAPIGYAVIGGLADSVDATPVLLGIVVVETIALVSLLSVPGIRHLRRLDSTPADAPAT